jgi:tetratricopeptide (TPR) repeat protein
MMKLVAGGMALPAVAVKAIAERSEGVPLFVEEVTKAVLESGALRTVGDRYELLRPLDEQFLPSTVHGSLVARFDRLGESRSVAQLGAAIGRQFAYPLLRAIANMSEAELGAHLDRLSRSELAFVQGDLPQSVYTFKHALIQDAIYATLLKSERARVHDRIFSALELEFPDNIADRPETAAYHAERAGRPDAAVPLLRDAGMKALRRTAVAEAVKHLAHAIELVPVLEEPRRTNLEIELQAAIGPAYMTTVGWAAREVEVSCARLRDLASAKLDGPRLFQAMWGLWTVHFLRGELDPALAIAQQVLAMAEQANDSMLRVTGHHAVGYTHFYRGEYTEAIRHADNGLALFDLEQEKRIAGIFQFSSSCALLCFRAQAQQVVGEAEQAAESVRRCQELDQALRHAPSRAYLLCLCYYFRMMGDVGRVKAWAPAARSMSAAEGFAFWVLVADIFLAWADARLGGDAQAAAEKIQAALDTVHEGKTYLVEPEYASMFAETLLLADRAERALEVTRDALTLSRRGHQRHCEPELIRLQGEAASRMGNVEQAAGFYREGLDSARSMGARLLELRCALALARLTGTAQDRGQLAAIVNGFGNVSKQPDVEQALAFLATSISTSKRVTC